MSVEISTEYLGLQLKSPVIVGSCPLTLNLETVRQLEESKAGAIVLPSLFEEQIVHEMRAAGRATGQQERQTEEAGYSLAADAYNEGTSGYLQCITALKQRSALPVIASLDGCTSGSWLSFATEIERSGADALELNLRTDDFDAATDSVSIEESLLECAGSVVEHIKIPVAVKLRQSFTSLSNLTTRLAALPVRGVVIFGREPTWEVELDGLRATSHWSLTAAGSIQTTVGGLIRVRMSKPGISVAASGGISSAEDAIKTIVAGADVVMVTSQVYREGPGAVAHIVNGMSSYLEQHGMASFRDLRASRPEIDAVLGERSAYLRPLTGSRRYDDPTPDVRPQRGDRWGHIS